MMLKYEGWGRNMEIYKWKWMLLGVLGYMNNVDFLGKKIVNNNIVLDVFIICQKL